MSPEVRAYLAFEETLHQLREKNQGQDSKDEDQLLDAMDALWWHFTPRDFDYMFDRDIRGEEAPDRVKGIPSDLVMIDEASLLEQVEVVPGVPVHIGIDWGSKEHFLIQLWRKDEHGKLEILGQLESNKPSPREPARALGNASSMTFSGKTSGTLNLSKVWLSQKFFPSPELQKAMVELPEEVDQYGLTYEDEPWGPSPIPTIAQIVKDSVRAWAMKFILEAELR